MKVFITGATGYIGYRVAIKFREMGHTVYGLTRSENKKDKLMKEEIIPVMGNMSDTNTFMNIAEKCDLLIHAAADYSEKMVEYDNNIVDSFCSLQQRENKIKFIYTSGCWVYGNTNGIANEDSELHPAKMVAWRSAVEEKVISSSNVNGIVIRPGCVYGKEGSLTNIWFNGAVNENKLAVIGDGKNHWAMIHVEDLADLFYAVYLSDCKNEIINAVDNSSNTVNKMVGAVSEVSGYKGEVHYVKLEEAINSLGPIAEPLAFDQRLDNGKAKEKLKWEPKFRGFAEEIDIFYNAWKSNKK